MAECRNLAITFQITTGNNGNDVVIELCTEFSCLICRQLLFILQQVHTPPVCIFNIVIDNRLRHCEPMVRTPICVVQAVVADELLSEFLAFRGRNSIVCGFRTL